MSDERLRLVAEVRDEFSATLDKLNAGLKKTGTVAEEVAKKSHKDFAPFHEAMNKSSGAIQAVSQGLQGLGIASLGAGLGVAGIATALRDFSKNTQGLSILSQQSGVAVNTIRNFQEVAKEFGVSVETSAGAVQTFGDSMRKFTNRYSESYASLKNMNLGDLAEKIIAAPNNDAKFKEALKGVQGIADADIQRQVSMMLFGTPDVSAVMGQLKRGILTEMEQIQKEMGKLGPETEKQAAEFEKNISRMGRAFEKLKFQLAGEFAKNLNGAIDAYSKGNYKDAISQLDRGKNWDEGKTRSAKDVEADLADRQGRMSDNAKSPAANTAAYVARQKELASEIAKLTEELRLLRQGEASVQKQSFNGGASAGGGLGGLIHRASFGGGGMGGAVGGVGAIPPLGDSGGGGNPNITGGGSGRGYGAGSSGGAPAISPNAPLPSFGNIGSSPGSSGVTANPGAYKDVLDHIARSEGTAHRAGGGYNTSLGYGQYLPGRQEQNLTSMTLDQISALGNHMRRQPGNPNSSALGRYQIVGKTMRGLMRKMGLKGDELFDEKMQDRMAAELARGRGKNATGLGQEWASLRGQRLARAVELMSQVDPRASTMPSNRVAEAAGSDAAVPAERSGDKVMRRFYGDEAPTMKSGGKGSLDITLHGFPAGAKPRASMDDLFKEVNVSKSRQMETTSI